jgi:hypothetical protein
MSTAKPPSTGHGRAYPAFANARGMLKYLRFVCEVPV